jgi:excisionase family DNA binding protein
MSIEDSNGDTRERLLSVKDAAQMLSVSCRTVWRMISAKELTPVHIRGCTRLHLADVLKLIQGGSKEGCS